MPANTAHTHMDPTDVQPDDMLDALVQKAALGDRRAVGALAIGLGPTLLEAARKALGARRADEDEDLLQDLFACLSHGKLPFVRGQDHACRGSIVSWRALPMPAPWIDSSRAPSTPIPTPSSRS